MLWVEEAADAVTRLKPRLIRNQYRAHLAQDPPSANSGDYGTGVVIRDARTAAAWRLAAESCRKTESVPAGTVLDSVDVITGPPTGTSASIW